MFYNTKLNNHNLKHSPFKSCIVPRPIGWISSVDQNNIVNLAPYSYFNAVADIPPVIMFASGFHQDGCDKDSLKNIEITKEFVVNIASYDLREYLNLTSMKLPYGTSEADTFSIHTSPSNIVKPPRVTEALINLECKYIRTIEIEVNGKLASSKMVLGHVVGININDQIISDGKIDISKLKPIARLGYDEYAVIEQVFSMQRP